MRTRNAGYYHGCGECVLMSKCCALVFEIRRRYRTEANIRVEQEKEREETKKNTDCQ